MRTEKQFWNRVDKSPACWIWTGYTNAKGYGICVWKGKTQRAHRVAARLSGILTKPSLMVCHHCDNPACVRPDHLFQGDNGDNIRDAVRKGRFAPHNRFKTHCIHGHPLSKQRYLRPDGYLERKCPTCVKRWSREQALRRKKKV